MKNKISAEEIRLALQDLIYRDTQEARERAQVKLSQEELNKQAVDEYFKELEDERIK